MNRFVLCLLASVMLLTGCKKDVSGSYLANGITAVSWLQLVRTPDNHVSGQLVASLLNQDGRIDHESVTLTGAVNGENIMLTGGGIFGTAQTTLSGTFDGKNTLTLTGAQSMPMTLKRATLADYQARLGEQTTRSQAMITGRAMAAARQRSFEAQKNFVAEINEVTNRMQQFDVEADIHLARFPNAEKKYEAITAKVNEYVSRERQLVGNSNRAVDRSQLDVAATQASLATDQIHIQAQSLESSFETNIVPLGNQAETLEQGCNRYRPARKFPEPTLTEEAAHQTACNRLLSALPMFHQKYAAMAAGLIHLEGVYKHEKDAQSRLLAAAEKMD